VSQIKADTRLLAVGDVMLGDSSHFMGRGVGTTVRQHGARFVFDRIQSQLATADIFFCNLESPLSVHPGLSPWERVYRAPASAGCALQQAATNVVSVANNHIFQHGPDVLDETLRVLETNNVYSSGFRSDQDCMPVTIVARTGLTLSFFAESLVPASDGRTNVDPIAIEKRIAAYLDRDKADCKIVSLHWGDEYVSMPSDTQRVLGHRLIDKGAQIILGHHPHVLQPVESYSHGVIAYSLGNFIFDQFWSNETRLGGILEIVISSQGDCCWEFYPTKINKQHQPEPVNDHERANAVAFMHSMSELGSREYFALSHRLLCKHRLLMKKELARNVRHVSLDTWMILLRGFYRRLKQWLGKRSAGYALLVALQHMVRRPPGAS
jgi:poly-gamma-glutamate synthesis protein (capsule biosynthesis protein)